MSLLTFLFVAGCAAYLFWHANQRSKMTDDEVLMEKMNRPDHYATFWGGLFHIGNSIGIFIGGFVLLFILGMIIDTATK
jgi:hypothetical protein